MVYGALHKTCNLWIDIIHIGKRRIRDATPGIEYSVQSTGLSMVDIIAATTYEGNLKSTALPMLDIIAGTTYKGNPESTTLLMLDIIAAITN